MLFCIGRRQSSCRCQSCRPPSAALEPSRRLRFQVAVLRGAGAGGQGHLLVRVVARGNWAARGGWSLHAFRSIVVAADHTKQISARAHFVVGSLLHWTARTIARPPVAAIREGTRRSRSQIDVASLITVGRPGSHVFTIERTTQWTARATHVNAAEYNTHPSVPVRLLRFILWPNPIIRSFKHKLLAEICRFVMPCDHGNPMTHANLQLFCSNSKRSFYRSFNAVFSRVGHIASEAVTVELLNRKYLPTLLYGLEACPLISG